MPACTNRSKAQHPKSIEQVFRGKHAARGLTALREELGLVDLPKMFVERKLRWASTLLRPGNWDMAAKAVLGCPEALSGFLFGRTLDVMRLALLDTDAWEKMTDEITTEYTGSNKYFAD